MKNIFIIILLLTLGFLPSLFAQDKARETGIAQIATVNTESHWYFFDKDVKPSAETINEQDMKKYFGFDQDNSFSFIKSETDKLKITHQVLQQTYKGYPIQFAIFKLHAFPDERVEGNGYFIPNFTKNNALGLTFLEALSKAKQYFPAQKYMWEDSLEEASIKQRKHNNAATYFPKEEIVWAFTNKNIQDLKVENYALAYKIIMHGSGPSFSKEVYIDAFTGQLINVFELEYNCTSFTFASNFNGIHHVYYTDQSSTSYLKDFCSRSDGITTSDNLSVIFPYSKSTSVLWPNTNDFRSACTSMWALGVADDYYSGIHGRTSWSGSGSFDIDLRQNAVDGNGSPANASFSGGSGICKVGNNESAGPGNVNTIVSDDWNTLDLLAHEITHGVTFTSAALVYLNESGALNESFSDIFGVNVYQDWGNSNGNLWKIGYDRTNAAGTHMYLRNMGNPHAGGALEGVKPDTYLTDPLWQNPSDTSDKGGVHKNSSVQNYMYYLLVQVGSGTNANSLSYNVTGIGFNQARAIAYRALTIGYLNPNSNHLQARSAWVHAAIDLYGACSVQSQTVGQAWEAVGVSYISPGADVCGSYSGPQSNVSYIPYLISGSGCTTTIIGNGSLVSFNGGGYVNISSGFNTNAGAFFTAVSNGCYYSNY